MNSDHGRLWHDLLIVARRHRLDPLPIDPLLPEIVAAASAQRAVVIQAAPGAGKTTRVPPALLEAGAAGQGKIIVLEPRRLAARAAARRMAEEGRWRLGEEVGYRIRLENRASAATRLLVVTEGVLIRMLQEDPLLDGIGVIVFDEVHERRLETDLALAMARRAQLEVRQDLVLVAMSATLDAAPLAAFLGHCPIVASQGRAHPVTIEHLDGGVAPRLEAHVALGVERALAATDGDVLVFLPGVGEIRRVQARLEGLAARQSLSLVPLFGDLPSSEQDRAIRPGSRRRVVLATNVAETSITVAGVGAVVDSGLARVLRYDPSRGLDLLELRRIARSNADQRAGRAGRLGPGLAIRLWSAHEDRGLAAHLAPEVRRVDLSGAVLQLLAWGEPDPKAFSWFEAPADEALEAALRLLELLGARARTGITAAGRRMAALGLHPRLARLVLGGHSQGWTEGASLVAAMLSERDVVQAAQGHRTEAETLTSSDVLDRLHAVRSVVRHGWGEAAAGPLDRGRARTVARLGNILSKRSRRILGPDAPAFEEEDRALRRALLEAYPDRVARRRCAGSPRAVMVGGRGVRLLPMSSVREADLFVCAELASGRAGERREAPVRQASAVDPEWLRTIGPGLRHESVAIFDDAEGRVVGRRRICFGDLVLEEAPCATNDRQAEEVLTKAALAQLARALPLDEPSVAAFLARLRFLETAMPEADLPKVDDDSLRELVPSLVIGRRSFAELRKAPLLDMLRGALAHGHLALLDREAPEHLQPPRGKPVRLQYREEGPPILALRIQQAFGWRETPTVAGGRVKVLLHLLAPNMRPQQITQDLASFWRTTYREVRRELAGRYPKHAWPEDPLA